MALENLKNNLEIEKDLLKEIFVLTSQLDNLTRLYPYEKREIERKMIVKTLNSLAEQLKIINDSVPELIDSISPYKGLDNKEEVAERLVKINYENESADFNTRNISVTIAEKDKDKFFKELSLSRDTVKRLRQEKVKTKPDQKFMDFKKAGIYARLSNKIFQDFSNKLLDKGKFKTLNLHLRKANMPYLVVTYLSMCFFSTVLALILGIIAFVVLILYMPENAMLLSLIVPGAPGLTFLAFYFYPSAERSSIEDNINQEIPFITIHMSAIAGSGIEPSQIFKIIALGDEYPYTRVEIKKIINQVNVYGYDLVTALKNTARETSSRKLSELLNGMASSISGGSELPQFLDKRAESLMFEYRLEKEKFAKNAETFMDIYISLMIAAPMIMTLLLVLIVVSRIDIGMSLNSLSVVIISVVSLINIIFLVFLHLSKSTY